MGEIADMTRAKNFMEKMLLDLETPVRVVNECLFNREKRQGIDLVHDQVERDLIKVKLRKREEGIELNKKLFNYCIYQG